MKLNFLCQYHRRWMQEDPARAMTTWLTSYDRAVELAAHANFPEAIRCAGSALEAAEIALLEGGTPGTPDIRRYTHTGVLLAQILWECGERRLARAVVCDAVAAMEQLLLRGIERREVLAGCEQLLRVGDWIPGPEPATTAPGASRLPLQSRQLH